MTLAIRCGLLLTCLTLIPGASGDLAYATPAPKKGVKFPKAFVERRKAQPTAFTYSRSLLQLAKRVQLNRSKLAKHLMTREAASAAPGGLAVSGSRSIPVLMSKFSNTASDPYPVSDLEKELFTGPWPTGTMTEYYKEISYNKFTVGGTVFPWKALPATDTNYEGGAGCNGVCNASKVGDFLKDTLDANDGAVNFAQYDNDGPDGNANSGDDDGYVDFVAFVHAESGGECGNENIWSHRWNYNGWTGSDYVTNDAKNGGGTIKINDYVIMPARACDGTTMIQIGVFAHEFGHAFGLPDLYDTDDSNGGSEGIGNWCLMAGGSWGGDGQTPETPVHMSAWAKAFLGWVSPSSVTSDMTPASLPNVESNASVLKVPISTTQNYLVENRQKLKFDKGLPTAGVLIWRINETAVNAGLANNSVNADENNKGVDLEEADGKKDLDNETNRGDDGDAFPGSAGKRRFDSASNPASTGSKAVCDIGDPADPVTATILVADGACPTTPATPPPATPTPSTPPPTPEPSTPPGDGGSSCSSVAPPGDGGGGGAAALLVAPILFGLTLLVRRRVSWGS